MTSQCIDITMLHCMQLGLSDRKAVCPSVCLFDKRMNCDKTNESSAKLLIPHKRSIHLLFRHEESLVGDVPFYLKYWAKLTPPRFKKRYSNRYLLVAPQSLHLAKKSSSITCQVHYGLSIGRKMNSIRCPKPTKGVQKRKMSVFSVKVDFFRRKSATTFLCENFQRQSCKAFTGLSICAQMVGAGYRFLPEILGQIDQPS